MIRSAGDLVYPRTADTSATGATRLGEKVRFKSLRQTSDAGSDCYLSREPDGYLATRAIGGADPGNMGIEWMIGA